MAQGKPAGRFFVTGLPRSRTAWMAAFLSTGETLCIHEPSCKIQAIEELETMLDTTFYRYIGVSESGLGFFVKDIIEKLKCRTLVIERDIGEVAESLRKIGVPMPPKYKYLDLLLDRLSEVRMHPMVKWVHFNSLVHKRVIQEVYWWLMPGIAFDEARWSEFSNLNIQVDAVRQAEKARRYQTNLEMLYRDVNARLRDLAHEAAA